MTTTFATGGSDSEQKNSSSTYTKQSTKWAWRQSQTLRKTTAYQIVDESNSLIYDTETKIGVIPEVEYCDGYSRVTHLEESDFSSDDAPTGKNSYKNSQHSQHNSVVCSSKNSYNIEGSTTSSHLALCTLPKGA
eukprot:GSA25T00016308001.1